MADIEIRKGDTLPYVQATLLQSNGESQNISNADVKFVMQDSTDGSEVFSKAAVKTDAENGEVEYRWDEEDTDEGGIFDAHWKVVFDPDTDSPETLHFPNDESLTVVIN